MVPRLSNAVTKSSRKVNLQKCIPHNYTLWVEFDGHDVWVGTSKGLALAKGPEYYRGLRAVVETAGVETTETAGVETQTEPVK